MEDSNNRKKTIISIISGVLVLLVFVVGAAFAYYITTGNSTTTTTAGRLTMEKTGTVSLTQGVSNIYLDVSTIQMAISRAGTDYYGVSTETTPLTTAQNHVLATISATGGETDTVYECTMGYSITTSQISGSDSLAFNALQPDDAEFVISTVPTANSCNTATNIAGSRTLAVLTLIQPHEGVQGVHWANAPLSETGTSIVKIHGNTSLQIVGDMIFHNLDDDQNDLADLGVNLSFGITSFSCNPIPYETVIALTTDSGTTGLSTGDVVTIAKSDMPPQSFYVVSSDVDETVLLAKYNLYVGRIISGHGPYTYEEILTTDNGYGLQSEDANYDSSGDSRSIAVVPFSGSGSSYPYWYDSTNKNVYSKYGTSAANNIYDTDYVTAPNWSVSFSNNVGNANYSLAYYVEEYVERLGIYGTGRLLTYTEKQALASSNNSIVNNGTSYWLGSARITAPYLYVWTVDSSGAVSYSMHMNSSHVRPVIVVPTSSIQTS